MNLEEAESLSHQVLVNAIKAAVAAQPQISEFGGNISTKRLFLQIVRKVLRNITHYFPIQDPPYPRGVG